MNTNSHAYIQTQVHTLVNTRTHTRTHTHIQKDICWCQRLSQTINSHRTFTDTNPGIKKNHHPIKTVTTIKTKESGQINHELLEDGSKVRNTCRSKKKKKNELETKFTCEHIHFKVYIYIYIYTKITEHWYSEFGKAIIKKIRGERQLKQNVSSLIRTLKIMKAWNDS